MQTLLEILAMIAVVSGTLFAVVGVMGLLRMPDVFCALHAVGKVSVFGTALVSMAAALAGAAPWGKALILILLLVAAAPVLSHAIGAIAYRLSLGRTIDDEQAAQSLTAASPHGDATSPSADEQPSSNTTA